MYSNATLLPPIIQARMYSSRRYLAAVDPVEEPSFYPNGGTYHHPIAVSLVSSDGSIIFYTIDGTSPDESSAFVVSGEIVVVEDSAILRAKAVYKNLLFSSYSSVETEASFVVYSPGTRLIDVPAAVQIGHSVQ